MVEVVDRPIPRQIKLRNLKKFRGPEKIDMFSQLNPQDSKAFFLVAEMELLWSMSHMSEFSTFLFANSELADQLSGVDFFLFSFSAVFFFTCSLESKEPLDSKEPVFIFTSVMKKKNCVLRVLEVHRRD